MKTRKTLIFSMLVFVLGLSLLMLGAPGKASAGSLTTAEWESIADTLHGYIQSQYVATDDGEAGFIYTPEEYKAATDTNNDGTVCGVGDDMANRPILVDNLIGTATLIPGTSIRSQWNSGVDGIGSMSPTILAALKAKVDAHRAAGFGTEISVY